MCLVIILQFAFRRPALFLPLLSFDFSELSQPKIWNFVWYPIYEVIKVLKNWPEKVKKVSVTFRVIKTEANLKPSQSNFIIVRIDNAAD